MLPNVLYNLLKEAEEGAEDKAGNPRLGVQGDSKPRSNIWKHVLPI